MEGDKKKPEAEAPGGPATPAAPAAGAKTMGAGGGKYVPPSMRDGAGKGRGEVMQSKRGMQQSRARGYKKLFMINSTELEIYPAHKC